jgi:hypothetical protein
MHPFFRFCLALAGVVMAALPAHAEDPAFKAELPVLVTSSGQALDGFTVKTLLTRAKVANDYKVQAVAADLADKKTLIVAIGASVKGFGAAGITADSEVARTKELLAEAKRKNIKTIGVHIGGAERREGLSKQFVELVTPAVDYLVVWEDGNADGYFNRVAEEKKIPLTIVKQPLEAGKVLSRALGQ